MAVQTDIRRPTQTSDALAAKSIDADYYNITDTNSWPVAGLLVLLDGSSQPVRSELHLFDELPSHIQEGAIRQARDILQSTYSSEATIPMRILQTNQVRDAVNIRLSESAPESSSASRTIPAFLYLALGVAALAVIAALLVITVGGGSIASSMELLRGERETPLAIVQEMIASSPTLNAGQETVERFVEPLPPSRNANPELAVGLRVAIVPDLRLTLRSEPGADLGVPLGYMMDEDTATIIGGPELAQGTSDTIVWWLVRLDDGTEAWAAANTSDETLLVPAQ